MVISELKAIELSDAERQTIKDALVDAVGAENLSDNEAVRSTYRGQTSHGLPQIMAPLPDFVCMPRTVEQVIEVVRIADRYSIPIVPISSGMVADSCFPWTGGILMDLMGMDSICQIDTHSGYAVVEPGVTFNKLNPELHRHGYRVPHGSYPCTASVLGSLAGMASFDISMSARIPRQCLGMEIVLPNAEVIRTGTAAYGADYWFDFKDFPSALTKLFSPSVGTMGVITKAAVRIYPQYEAQALPIIAFDDFAKSMEYSWRVCRAGITDQVMTWNWVKVLAAHAVEMKSDIGRYFNDRINTPLFEAPEGMHYNYTLTTLSGYREQLDGYVALCNRFAKEIGGTVIPHEEFKRDLEGCWRYWEGYLLHEHRNQYLKTYHDGAKKSFVFCGPIEDLVGVEKLVKEQFYHEFGIPAEIPYYTRIYDQARSAHLRFAFTSDLLDQGEVERIQGIQEVLLPRVFEKYPRLYAPPRPVEYKEIGKIELAIRNLIDPKNIMNPAFKSKSGFAVGSTIEPWMHEEDR